MDFTKDISTYFDKLKCTIDLIDKESISELMNLLLVALNNSKQILIMGNGGSAATASHFVCDFNKGVSYGKEKRFKFLCLNDNVATLMAYGNDTSYSDIFVEPLKNYLQSGDLVIGISGSGNSQNVIKAIEWANANGAITAALTGFNGGRLIRIAQHNVNIPIDDMQITEDLHMVLDHCIMKIFYSHLK